MNTNDNSRWSKDGRYTTIRVSVGHWCVPLPGVYWSLYLVLCLCTVACTSLLLTTMSLLHPSPPLPILPLLSSLLLLPLPSIQCLQGSGSPDEHALYVWDRYVDRSAAKRIDIVAHSYGGCVTVTLVREPCVTVTLVRESCVTVTLVRELFVTVTSGRRTVCHSEMSKRTMCHCDIGESVTVTSWGGHPMRNEITKLQRRG